MRSHPIVHIQYPSTPRLHFAARTFPEHVTAIPLTFCLPIRCHARFDGLLILWRNWKMQRNVFSYRGQLVCKYWNSSHFFFFLFFYLSFFISQIFLFIVFYGDKRTVYKIGIYRIKLCILNIRITVDKKVSLGCRWWISKVWVAFGHKKTRLSLYTVKVFVIYVFTSDCKKLWLVNNCKRNSCTRLPVRELLILVVERMVYADACCRWIGAIIQFIIRADLTNAADRKIGTFAEIQPRPREISVKYLSLGRECKHKLFL